MCDILKEPQSSFHKSCQWTSRLAKTARNSPQAPAASFFGQYVTLNNVSYHIKGGPLEGIYYTKGNQHVNVSLQSPSWSPDRKTVVYKGQTRHNDLSRNPSTVGITTRIQIYRRVPLALEIKQASPDR